VGPEPAQSRSQLNPLHGDDGGAAVTSDTYNVFDVPTGVLTDTASETRWGGVSDSSMISRPTDRVDYDHMIMDSRDVSFATLGGVVDVTD
jgi:outer membrane immunogenic protein